MFCAPGCLKEVAMITEELKTIAVETVERDNPEGKGFKIYRAYDNVMDGTLITVTFHDAKDHTEYYHVQLDRGGSPTSYRYNNDVFNAVSNYKERIWFFRFLEFAGMGGLIAVILVIVFSLLLCVLAFSSTANASIVEVVNLSFTT